MKKSARAAAAAYCLRLLVGRNRDVMSYHLSRWLVACAAMGAAEHVYAVEEYAALTFELIKPPCH